jgi:hypothetical protein
MYSVSPATQTLCTPPNSGSYHATERGFSRSETSSTCSRPYARPRRGVAGALHGEPGNTSSAMKT